MTPESKAKPRLRVGSGEAAGEDHSRNNLRPRPPPPNQKFIPSRHLLKIGFLWRIIFATLSYDPMLYFFLYLLNELH